MACCRKQGVCVCRVGGVFAALGVLALFVVAAFALAGCAAGKAYERGPDGKMQERLVFGVDAGKLAEGATATIGSLTDPGTLAALAGVVIPGAGALGAIFGLRRGERKGWEEREAHQATIDATYYEGATRSLERPAITATVQPTASEAKTG